MTTDNRTNGQLSGIPGQLPDEQVEAAAKALYCMVRGIEVQDFEWPELSGADRYRAEARAALVAAAGVAPQAEAYDHCCNHSKCPGGSLCCCASEQRLRDCWNQWREEVAGDTKQAFRDAYSAGRNDPAPWAVAPVLPSSGVDEDALADVIGKVTDSWDEPLDEVHDIPQIARAVAAWLKDGAQ